MSLLSELRRRNVFRMAVLYVVAAWLMMQVAEVVIDLAHLPDWIGPAVLGLLAIGFPIALIFSWIYELTPEGIALEKDVDRDQSITHVTGRRMDFIVIALMSAALMMFAWHTWWPTTPTDKSIAVLAFENMSADPEQEYFSDGVAEELLNSLAQVPDLRVISRSSSFSFKGQDVDIPTVAKQLNVAHIVEGSVRKMGSRVRITAQLIDASSDSHLWSQTYDRELGDIFSVQEDISAAVTAALKERLDIGSRAAHQVSGTMSTDAYDAYLRGRYLVVQRTRTAIEDAVREFEKAISMDPDYALAYAELAVAKLLSSDANYGGFDHEDAVAIATEHVERALTLDPVLAKAHAAKGFLAYNQGDIETAMPHYERAIELNPNQAIVHTWAGIGHNILGNYKAALAAGEVACRLDPLSGTANFNYVLGLIKRNRLDEARREAEKLTAIAPHFHAIAQTALKSLDGNWANLVSGRLEELRLDPTNPVRVGNAMEGLAWLGLAEDALDMARNRDELSLNRTYLMLGMYDKLIEDADEDLRERPDDPAAHGYYGFLLAATGEYTHALPHLEEAWDKFCKRKITKRRCYVPWLAAWVVSRRAAGEDAAEIVAAIKDDARRYYEAGLIADLVDESADFEMGLAEYLDGNRDTGLAMISKAAEGGYFIPLTEAYLQELYDDPGFAPIRASQEARQARERERFLAVVCTDNPYADVWQPAAGTCERYAM